MGRPEEAEDEDLLEGLLPPRWRKKSNMVLRILLSFLLLLQDLDCWGWLPSGNGPRKKKKGRGRWGLIRMALGGCLCTSHLRSRHPEVVVSSELVPCPTRPGTLSSRACIRIQVTTMVHSNIWIEEVARCPWARKLDRTCFCRTRHGANGGGDW